VGVEGAVGRLVELGERERRKKLVTPRALFLRNGDRGFLGLFGGRGVGGVEFQ